jgi:hypothetical protein
MSGAPIYGKLRALPTNIRHEQKGLRGDKRSSLFSPSITDEEKSSMTLTPGGLPINFMRVATAMA